jgi:hypothetical protein
MSSWLIVAFALSLAASAIGTWILLTTDLPERLNPDLRELRLQHEQSLMHERE